MMTSVAFAKDSDWHKRTGIRFGYAYINGVQEAEDLNSPGEVKRIHPHTSVLGFEMQQAMAGGGWLDILFIENVSLTGLDQSVINPSASLLVGFEIDKQIQLGVGPHLSFFDASGENRYIHLIVAAGYTAQAGLLSVPLHVTFVPDVDGFWAMAITTGVNW